MGIPLIQVDAFADRPFTGNPAAVCLLDAPADADWMQAVAAEMNLSETAFVRPLDTGFELRWFTPAVEVELCGHATLAAAHALWSQGVVTEDAPIEFSTLSGTLVCSQRDRRIELDFPATPVDAIPDDVDLAAALGVDAVFTGASKFDRLVRVDSEAEVRRIEPDLQALRRIPVRGVIVTATSDDPRFDFVSRFFAPAAGVDEDPVTGSAHCALGPFWGEQLGRTEMTAVQVSSRSGVVAVRLHGDRVTLGGSAVTVFEGVLV